MPEIKGEAIAEVEAPTVGVIYDVIDVEEFTSAVRTFKGYRVTLQDKPDHEVVATLWKQEVYGPNSKIGAFVEALGKNTDDWKGKRIRFDSWVKGNRVIRVLPPAT